MNLFKLQRIYKKEETFMRVVVSGGGTGGRIYPALAFMRYLETQEDVEYL